MFDMRLVFNYLFNVHSNCLDNERLLRDSCSESVIDELGLPLDRIYDCMVTSYEVAGDTNSENDLLRKDRVNEADLGI